MIRHRNTFTPRELFSRMQGAWFEPRIGYMYALPTGKSAITTAGETVGAVVDLSQQPAFGPELVANGGPGADTTGWTARADATISIVDGKLQIQTNATQYAFANQGISTKIGQTYYITAKVWGDEAYCIITNESETASPEIKRLYSYTDNQNGTYFTAFVATATTTYIGLFSGIFNGSICRVSNISVKQVIGGYVCIAEQPTAANRPIYQLDAQSLPLIRHDATDVLTAAMPDLGGGVFSSAGSVYFATPTGMSCLHNQSIGTTYNLPAPNTDIYGTVITPARLAPPLEQRLALYMHRLAGLSDADFFWQEQATDGMAGQLLTDDGTILLRG